MKLVFSFSFPPRRARISLSLSGKNYKINFFLENIFFLYTKPGGWGRGKGGGRRVKGPTESPPMLASICPVVFVHDHDVDGWGDDDDYNDDGGDAFWVTCHVF